MSTATYIPIQFNPRSEIEHRVRLNFDLIALAIKNVQASAASGGGGGGSSSTTAPLMRKIQITHTQLQTAALTNSATIYTLPGRWKVLDFALYPTTAFAGTGMTTYQLGLGVAGDSDTLQKYLPLFEVTTAVSDTNGTYAFAPDIPSYGTTTTAIKLYGVSDANLSLSTAGAADIWITIQKLN